MKTTQLDGEPRDEVENKQYQELQNALKQSPLGDLLKKAHADQGNWVDLLPGGFKDIIFCMALGLKSIGSTREEAVEEMIENSRNIPLLQLAIKKSRLAKTLIDAAFAEEEHANTQVFKYHEELSPCVHVDSNSCQSGFPAGYGFSPQYGSLDVLVLIGQEQVNKPRAVIAGVLDGPYDELPGSDMHTHPDDVAIQHAEKLRPETKLVNRTSEFKINGPFDRVYIREGADEVKSRELAELLIANL